MTPEIRAFEYALGLFAVVIGLAIADVATSFHRLVRSQARVVWDPLTLLAALYALCLAVGMWFDLWGVRHSTHIRHFFFYLWMLADMFLLFLLAAASLPDGPGETTDLREHYARSRRYYWTLVTLFQLSYLLNGLYFVGPMVWPHLTPGLVLVLFVTLALPSVVAPVLLLSRSRMVHYVGVVILFVQFAFHYAPYEIN